MAFTSTNDNTDTRSSVYKPVSNKAGKKISRRELVERPNRRGDRARQAGGGWLLAVVSSNTDAPFKSRKAAEEITQENC